MAFKETIGGIVVLGVAASGIWFFIEKSVLTPTLLRGEPRFARAASCSRLYPIVALLDTPAIPDLNRLMPSSFDG